MGRKTACAAPGYFTNSLLGWYVEGMDFADALHLSHCDHLERLKTFDQHFIKQAAGKSSYLVEEP